MDDDDDDADADVVDDDVVDGADVVVGDDADSLCSAADASSASASLRHSGVGAHVFSSNSS